MPEFLPFAGLRFDGKTLARQHPGQYGDPDDPDLGAVVAPPYDVIDDDERAALEARDPHNAVRLILPRDGARDDRYTAAAATIAQWRDSGVLRRDPQARFYGYRMRYRDMHGSERHTLGVLGALGLPEPGARSVLPHERTLPKAKSDRLALLRATRANLDPIWGLSPAAGLSALVDTSRRIGRATDDAGVEHEMFAIEGREQIAAITSAVASAPLVLADGHHRFETANAYRDELGAAGRPDSGAAAILCFVVELADDELCIEPIHRLLAGVDGEAIASTLADAFTVHDAGTNQADRVEHLEQLMRDRGGIGLVTTSRFTVLVPRHDVCATELASEPEPVRDTDAALVESVIVPRLSGASWTYRHDSQAVAALVAKGEYGAGLLLRPVSVAQTRAAALAGVRMPQKTTFFWPKPRTGMVFRLLD